MKPTFQHPTPRCAIQKANSCLLVVAFFVATTATLAAESVSVLLQKAIYAEETEGNLDAAIKIYEGITKETDANRSLVAQAHYRLGMCQLKKGKKDEAAVTFRTLVEQFPNEADLAAKSRDRLVELGRAPGEIVRRLDFPGGTPSPDGRYLIYIKDTGNVNLGLYEIATGRSRVIRSGEGEAGPFWGGHVSPDGRQIAYVWMRADGGLELHVTDIDPVRSRLIRHSENTVWINLEEWSPDGQSLLVSLQARTKQWRIGLLSIADGSFREVQAVNDEVSPIRFSPDARYIAYYKHRGGIHLADVKAGKENLALDHPADGKPIGWVPGKNTLLFLSERTGTTAIWAADFEGGKLAADPRLIKANFGGMTALGITRTGDFYFQEGLPSWDIYIAKVNFGSGHVSQSPKRATTRFPGYNTRPAWSSDGKKLAFHIEQKPMKFSILSLATGEQREFSMVGLIRRPFHNYAWSKDDSFIVGQNWDSEDESGIYRLDTVTGDVSRYMTNRVSSEMIGKAQFSPDGTSLLYVRERLRERVGSEILRRDLKTGRDETVCTSSRMIWHFELSPDGKNMALITKDGFGTADSRRNTMRVVPVAGGGERTLLTTEKPEELFSVHWTTDGRRLAYIKVKGNEVWSMPADGGESVKVNLPPLRRIRYLSLNSDGETIAFQSGDYNYNTYVIENFPSLVAAAK